LNIIKEATDAQSTITGQDVKSSLKLEPNLSHSGITSFLENLPAPIYFMGEKKLVKGRHDLQQIILDYIISKHPKKMKEIQHVLGGNIISRNKFYNKFYTTQRGSRKGLGWLLYGNQFAKESND
jgi:hypothetical protein